MSSANLSLYQIETELLDLLRFREDTVTDADMTPAEQAETLATVDRQIEEYIKREVKKADGIASYLRECETRAEALKAEAKRLKERADAWEQRHDRIKSGVLRVMQLMGFKKIEGQQSTLAIRKNPASVDIRQPELVPEVYQRVTVTLNASLWNQLCAANPGLATATVNREPSKSAIKEALKRGDGVPGCELREGSVRLEVE